MAALRRPSDYAGASIRPRIMGEIQHMTTAPTVVPETPADHTDIVHLPGAHVTAVVLVRGAVEYVTRHEDGSRTVVIRAEGSYDHEPRYVAVCEPLRPTIADGQLARRLRPGESSQFVLSATAGALVLLDAVDPARPPQAALMAMVARLSEIAR